MGIDNDDDDSYMSDTKNQDDSKEIEEQEINMSSERNEQ